MSRRGHFISTLTHGSYVLNTHLPKGKGAVLDMGVGRGEGGRVGGAVK